MLKDAIRLQKFPWIRVVAAIVESRRSHATAPSLSNPNIVEIVFQLNNFNFSKALCYSSGGEIHALHKWLHARSCILHIYFP